MKRKTIRNHRDFLTSPDNPSVMGLCFVVRVKPAQRKDPRYGIIASKHIFKNAVNRNRAKRLLRDWIAFNEDLMLPDMDYIFIAREPVLECTREIGREKVANALKKFLK